jgi:hypothetical protein
MGEHPAQYRLEELAAGGGDEQAARHVASCERCRGYVQRLQQASASFVHREQAEAFADAVLARTASRPSGSWRRVVAVTVPVLAAAAAVALLATPDDAPPERVPGSGPLAQRSTHEPAVRFKGRLQLAVVRQRDGDQRRLRVDAGIRAGDRLRAEVSLDRAMTVEVGVLDVEGAWVTLMPPQMLPPGTHYSPHAVRFDDAPSDAWVIAGTPQAVDQARRTRRLENVTVVPLAVEPPP